MGSTGSESWLSKMLLTSERVNIMHVLKHIPQIAEAHHWSLNLGSRIDFFQERVILFEDTRESLLSTDFVSGRQTPACC